MRRWAIYIDVEGFSATYARDEVRALLGIGAIMEGIYFIGTKVCGESPNRLFVHQTGDGFVIVSEFGLGRPQFPLAIATILMRHALQSGCLTKAGVSEGDFADIRGCFPGVIRRSSDIDGTVRLGQGLMRVFPVMGTALINAHTVTTRKKGALLLLDAAMAPGLGNTASVESSGVVAIDWVHADFSEIRDVAAKASIALRDANELESLLQAKVEASKGSVSDEWVENTLNLNGLGGAGLGDNL